MLESFGRGGTSAVGSNKESFTNQVGLSDGFDRLCFFTYRDRKSGQSNRSPSKTPTDCVEYCSVKTIETVAINLEQGECALGSFKIQSAASTYLGIVDDATKKAIGNTRGAS